MLNKIKSVFLHLSANRSAGKARFDRALAQSTEAIRLFPNNAAALSTRSYIHIRLEDPENAFRDATRAIELMPGLPGSYINRAIASKMLGEFASAEADIDYYLILSPDNAGALGQRAAILMAQDRPEQAIDVLARAIKLKPKEPELHTSRGHGEFALGHFNHAAEAYDRAYRLKRDPAAFFFSYLARARAAPTDPEILLRLPSATNDAEKEVWTAGELFCGRITPLQFMSLVKTPREKALACFYIGQYHLVNGREQEAIAPLHFAAEKLEKAIVARVLASADLARLAVSEKRR